MRFEKGRKPSSSVMRRMERKKPFWEIVAENKEMKERIAEIENSLRMSVEALEKAESKLVGAREILPKLFEDIEKSSCNLERTPELNLVLDDWEKLKDKYLKKVREVLE